MQIQVLDVKINTVPTAKGSYQKAEIAYKNLSSGKIEGKTIMSFTEKEVFTIVAAAKAGEEYTVTQEKKPGKDGKEYWTWVDITKGVVGVAQPQQQETKGYSSPKSTYETPAERATKQDYIIRQSSLGHAVAVLSINPGKEKLNVDDVLALAETFVGFVYNKPLPVDAIIEMEDDIPL